MLAAVSFAGVDVGFVPTDSAAARAALAWAGVGPGDSVFELGCGDGRVAEEARAAARAAGRHLPNLNLPLGESPRTLVVDNWITPNALFFVRNHHPVR